VKANREVIYQALLGMDSPTTGIQGVADSIYFDPSRNTVSTARFGVYQNGQLISAMTQFEDVVAPEPIQARRPAGTIEQRPHHDGQRKICYVANVVYTGVDMIDIHDVDIKNSTYIMDFYLWFRYRANSEDKDFKPATFVLRMQ